MNDSKDNMKKDKQEVEKIDCLEAIDSMYAFLDDELNDETKLAEFKQHLGHCKSCYTRSELEGVITDRLKKSGKEQAPESLKNRLHNIMDEL